MAESEQVRVDQMMDSQIQSTKRRFGLFSQPLSNAIGDNGSYKKKVHPRDPVTNKPLTLARNFQTSPTKSGRGNSSYFQQLKSLATSPIKDEYIQQGKRLMKQQKQKRDKGKKHDVSFFTGAGNKVLSSASYPYKQQNNPQKNPRRFRQEDGRVKSELKNITSNLPSTINKSYFKQPKYQSDPYDRKHQSQLEWQRKNKSLERQATFFPNSFASNKLNSDRKVYEVDVEIKKKPPKQVKLNILKHDTPWRSSNPNKSGIYGYIAPFPEHKPDPPRQIKRKQPKQGKKQQFKLNNSLHTSSPTNSISLNRSNIMRSLK